jgi:hypothetical protein
VPPEYITDEAQLLTEVRDLLAELVAALNEFLPYARAYLDPDQSGPRGWAIRRQLAKQNGRAAP